MAKSGSFQFKKLLPVGLGVIGVGLAADGMGLIGRPNNVNFVLGLSFIGIGGFSMINGAGSD